MLSYVCMYVCMYKYLIKNEYVDDESLVLQYDDLFFYSNLMLLLFFYV